MINDWNNNTAKYGEQTTASSGKNYIDLWGAIQDGQYNIVSTALDSKKWFIPSKSEWCAFGGELEITQDDYRSKGLSERYWFSSQCSEGRAYYADLDCRSYDSNSVNDPIYVRLSTTF